MIHHYVEILDRYFGNVCELDLIFNFHKAYFIMDEVFLNGDIQESSKKVVLRVISAQDALMENQTETSVFGLSSSSPFD
jgi:AP-1 complex subunit sigma 1/2